MFHPPYMLPAVFTSALILSACNNEHQDQRTSAFTVTEPKIIIIGHRGASALRPEHTLAAY